MNRSQSSDFWSEIHLKNVSGARYRALAGIIQRGIEGKILEPGSKLPPLRDLAYDLGVTVGTVGRAYDLLMRQGVLRGEVGRGTFVCNNDTRSNLGGIDLDDAANRPSALNLSVNMPIRTQAMDRMADLYAGITANRGATDLVAQYPPAYGVKMARTAAAEWLESMGVSFERQQPILTGGAQAGVASTLAAIGRAGDGVMLESLCFSRFATVTRALGMKPEAISIDEHGLVPEALESSVKQGRGRLLIVSPAMNNPTGAFLPEERRREIAKICSAHDIWVIEDDVYGPLALEEAPKLQTMIPERTVYVTSLSKFLAPGMRIGIVCPPSRLSEKVTARHGDLAIAAPAHPGLAFAEAWRVGLLDEAILMQKQAISERQAIARYALPADKQRGPAHAPHLWLDCGEHVDDVVLRLAGEGIKVAAGRCFAVDPRATVECVRVSLGPADEGQLSHACKAIESALRTTDFGQMTI